MRQRLKKIYTVVILLLNLVFRRKYYTLTFKAEEINGPSTNPYAVKLWYYNFEHWGFDKHNLLMISGADKLCEMYAQGNNEVTVEIIASKREQQVNNEEYDHYEADELPNDFRFWEKITYGRNYHSIEQKEQRSFWICPVTLFVLGRYPKHIYIKKKC